MGNSDMKAEWRRFSEEYVIDWNGTRAYMVAYPNCKESTAAVNASKLLRNTKVKAYIDKIKDNLSLLTGITLISQALELKKVAYSNASDLKKDWETFKDWDDLTEAQKTAISEITHSETTIGEEMTAKVVKVKMHDKLKALAMLNKMFGFGESETIDPFKDLSFKIVQKK